MPDKILLVDEQLYMLRLIQHHLEKAGYELIPARNADEARAALEQARPRLMVGDAPVLTKLQSADTEPIPAICVTDSPATRPGEPGHDTDCIFHKPFSPTQLVAQVKKLIPQPSPGGSAL